MNKWTILLASSVAIVAISPTNTEASGTYTVKSGDTLSKIAATYNVTIEQIKRVNGLTTDHLRLGQVLKIQDVVTKKKATLIASTTKKSVASRPTSAMIGIADEVQSKTTYNVAKGDTLSKIATAYNTTVVQLKGLNNLSGDLIFVGQVLIVPGAAAPADIQPDIDFANNELSVTDFQIKHQLETETAKIVSPSAKGLALYEDVLALANELKGIPYLFGGNTVAGFDCSGFISYIFSMRGASITRKSSLDYFLQDTTKVNTPIPGDVVFFKNTYIAGISHMGVYIGDGQFIHAGSKGIEISKLSYAYWKERFVTFKRFNSIK